MNHIFWGRKWTKKATFLVFLYVTWQVCIWKYRNFVSMCNGPKSLNRLFLSLHQYDSSSLVVIWLKQWLLLKLHKAQKQNKLRNWDRDNKQWLHRLSSRWVSHSWNYQACSSEMISEWRGCCLLVSGRLIKALSLFCLVKTEIVWAPLACWFDGRLLLWSFHFVLSFIWPWIDFYLPNSPFSFAPFYLSVTLFSNLMQKAKQDYRSWIKMQISKSNSSSSLLHYHPPFLFQCSNLGLLGLCYTADAFILLTPPTVVEVNFCFSALLVRKPSAGRLFLTRMCVFVRPRRCENTTVASCVTVSVLCILNA